MAFSQHLALAGLLVAGMSGPRTPASPDEFTELCRRFEETRKEVKGLTAELRVDRTGKFEDASTSAKGRLWWKTGTLVAEETEQEEKGAKPVRTCIREGEAVVLRPRPRRAEIYKLDRYVFAVAFVRDGLYEQLRQDWDVAIAERPEQSKLPESLKTKDGEAPKPKDVKLPGGRPKTGSKADEEAGRYLVLELKPLKDPIREYVTFVRIYLNKDTLAIEKLAIDDTMNYSVYRFTDWKLLDPVDDRLFEFDLTGVPTDRK